MDDDFPDIFVVGTGMVGAQQLTREAWTAMENSGTVYVIHPQDIFKEYLVDDFDTEVKFFSSMYREERDRRDIYEGIAAQVIDDATSESEPVTLALYGHPTVGVSPSTLVQKKAADTDVDVEFVPGVSSIGCMFTDLGIDPFDGLQMYEATDMLIHEYELNSDVPLLLFQIGGVETVLHSENESDRARFDRLKDFLLQYYPNDHEVTLIRSATYPFSDPDVTVVNLGNFESIAEDVTKLHSLYVPRASAKEVENEALAGELTSTEHLEEITES